MLLPLVVVLEVMLYSDDNVMVLVHGIHAWYDMLWREVHLCPEIMQIWQRLPDCLRIPGKGQFRLGQGPYLRRRTRVVNMMT